MRGTWRRSVLGVVGVLVAVASGGMSAAGQAQGPGEGKTLREVLAAEKLPLDAETLRNLDAKISSGAELNDAQKFVIAYYVLDATGQLNPPMYVDIYDRGAGRWKSGEIRAAEGRQGGVDDNCFGSVLAVVAFSDSYVVETHINPSAGCELIVSRDLKVKASLYGWIVGHFGDGGIVYHRSQIHFSRRFIRRKLRFMIRRRERTSIFSPMRHFRKFAWK